MKLKNRFSEYDYNKYWQQHPYCALCGSNKMVAIHHIEGTSNGNISSSIPLCYHDHLIADSFNVRGGTAGKEFRNKLKEYTKKWIEQVDSEYI